MKKIFHLYLSNAQIYERLLKNDSEVFVYLERKIFPFLVNNISKWSLTLSIQDAEDCLQSVFCEIVESIQKNDDLLKIRLSNDKPPFVPYLINKCKIQLIKKSRKDKINNNTIKRVPVESSIESAEETIINQEEIEFAQRLVDEYVFNAIQNTRDLEIILLKYWGDLGYDEIARKLNYVEPRVVIAAHSHIINYIRNQLVAKSQLNLPNNINREKSTNIRSILLKAKENLLLPIASISKSIFSDRNISCTLLTPPSFIKREILTLQVTLHIQEKISEVRRHALKTNRWKDINEYCIHLSLKKGEKINLLLQVEHIEVKNSEQTLTWKGETVSTFFYITIPENYNFNNIVGKIVVIQKNFPVGELAFNLESIAKEIFYNKSRTARRYENAFVSYSRKDKPEVLKRVQLLNVLGIEYFQDIFSIRSGEFWEERIIKYIEKSDLFLLFWSVNAQKSRWVKEEWQYALSLQKSRNENIPNIIPIQVNKDAPHPPKELSHIQFKDFISMLIE